MLKKEKITFKEITIDIKSIRISIGRKCEILRQPFNMTQNTLRARKMNKRLILEKEVKVFRIKINQKDIIKPLKLLKNSI